MPHLSKLNFKEHYISSFYSSSSGELKSSVWPEWWRDFRTVWLWWETFTLDFLVLLATLMAEIHPLIQLTTGEKWTVKLGYMGLSRVSHSLPPARDLRTSCVTLLRQDSKPNVHEDRAGCCFSAEPYWGHGGDCTELNKESGWMITSGGKAKCLRISEAKRPKHQRV